MPGPVLRCNTALNGQQSLLTVAVARFVEGRKLHYSLSGLHRPISIPQWTPAGLAELLRGWVQSCIFHIGDGPHSGHYRCIWRKTSDDNWQSTEDGRSSAAASESDMRQYCWCVPSSGPACCWPPLTSALTVTGFPCGQGHLPLLQRGCSTGSEGRNREQNSCCLGTSFCFPPSATAMAGTTSPKSEPAKRPRQAMEGAAARTDRPKANRELRPLTVQEPHASSPSMAH